MEISPERDLIQSMFTAASEALPSNAIKLAEMRLGVPIFVKEDILKVPYMTSRLLRYIFVEYGITKEFLTAKCREYATNELATMPSKAAEHPNNLIASICRDNVTIKSITETFAIVLGITVNLELVLGMPDGERKFNYAEIMQKLTD